MISRALFGVIANTLDEARDLVENQLGLSLNEGEGIYNGGIYYALPFPDDTLKLRNNVDLDGGDDPADHLAEPDFPNHKFLLYLEPSDELLSRLQKIKSSDRFEILRSS